ncbi:MAG: hypothetical protein NW216_05330 [Hyphomicrobium sp.]|nr:hypothetical protein [Hyphomicrobium sp.]
MLLMLVSALVAGFLAITTFAGVAEGLGAGKSQLTWALSGLAIIAVIYCAFAGRTASRVGMLTGGGDMGPVLTAMAVAASWASFGAFTVLPGLVYENGFDALLPIAGLIGGLVVMQALVAPYVYRSGALTVPEFIGMRFGPVVRGVAALLVVMVALPIMLATLAIAADIASRAYGIAPLPAIAAIAALTATVLAIGGFRAALWAGAFQFLIILAAFLVPLVPASWNHFGNPIPQIAYGPALLEIDRLEAKLAEAGLVDFTTFRPFLRPNMDIDPLNWGLIALVIAAGTAAMPQVAQRFLAVRSAEQSRRAVAWTALFALLIFAALPAYATVFRLQLTRLAASETPTTDLPTWVWNLSATDTLRLHGVSAGMLLRPPPADASSSLPPDVDAALETAASGLSAEPGEPLLMHVFKSNVLPVAVNAAGGDGKLTLSAMELETDALPLAFTSLEEQPAIVAALVLSGTMLAALASLAALAMTVASAVSHDIVGVVTRGRMSERWDVFVTRGAIVATCVVAAVIAYAMKGLDLAVLMLAAISIAAVGLLPMLLAAVWCRRATAAGVLLGLVAGLGASGYYALGTGPYAVTFADTWSSLSNADVEAVASFEESMSVWLQTPDDAARAEAYETVRSMAGGTLVRPGVANWFGIAPAANAVIGLPLALLLSVLVGLIPRHRKSDADDILARLHP